MNLDDEIVIKLGRAKALAIFEWAYRFMSNHNIQFTHPADAIVVDTIASELEWELKEVFTDEYPTLLEASRAKVVSEYLAALHGHAKWLDELTYQDVDQAK